MRKLAIVWHLFVFVVGGLGLSFYWFVMITCGNGYYAGLGPIGFNMVILLLGTIIALPACLFSGFRALQLGLGWLPGWRSLRALSGVFSLMILALAVGVGIVDTPWQAIFHTNWVQLIRTAGHATAAPELGDESLDFPTLPIQAQDLLGWSVTDLTGKEMPMAEMKGKVIFLNFWATWCGPCRAEMPSLQRLYDKLKARDMNFLFVSNEEPDVVKKFIEEGKYSFPVYVVKGKRPRQLSPGGIPTTYIFSPDGELAFDHTGSAAWDTAKTVDFLTALGAAPKP